MLSYKVKANNILLFFETQGNKQNVVFLPGMGDNSQMWWNQVKQFSLEYRILMPDYRGTGKSDRPKGEYTIDVMGKDMAEWWRFAQLIIAQDLDKADDLAAIKTAPVWVGYSMGGRVALEVAAVAPDYVKAIVMVSSGLGLEPPNPDWNKRREEMAALLQKNDVKKWAEMMTDAAFSPGFKQKNGKAWEQYMKVKSQQKNDGLLNQMAGMGKAAPPDLSKVKVPVLFVVGQNDQGFGPEQAKKAQAALPNSKVVVLPTGHASPIEAPDQFNKTVIDFIKSLK